MNKPYPLISNSGEKKRGAMILRMKEIEEGGKSFIYSNPLISSKHRFSRRKGGDVTLDKGGKVGGGGENRKKKKGREEREYEPSIKNQHKYSC